MRPTRKWRSRWRATSTRAGQEGCSVWVVRSDQIVASDPADKGMYFDPMEDKVYRHPTFYKLPSEVDHM